MARQQSAGYFQYYPSSDFPTILTNGLDISRYQWPFNPTTAYSVGNRYIINKAAGYTYTNPADRIQARYIRVSANTNNLGPSFITREIKVYNNSGVEVAAGKTVTTSTAVSGAAWVDGSLSTFVNVGNNYCWIKVDLGSAMPIYYLVLWNYYVSGIYFNQLKIEFSTDNTNWTLMYDGTVSGTYLERNALGLCLIPSNHNLLDDTSFLATNLLAERQAGHKIGFYWFKNPSYHNTGTLDWNNTVADAEAEATLFKQKIDAQMGGSDYGDLMPVLDFENNLANIYPSCTNDEAYDFIEAFVNKFKTLTGRQVMLYTAFYTLEGLHTTNANCLVHSTKGNIANVCPIWLSANYGSGTYPGYNYTIFGGYTEWQLWQWGPDNPTGYYNGASSTSIDLNVSENLDIVTFPSPPANFNAIAGNEQVTLSWTQSPHTTVTGYKIYRNNVMVHDVTDETTIIYVDTGLVNDTLYTYKITAYTTWDESTFSAEVTSTPTSTTTLVPSTLYVGVANVARPVNKPYVGVSNLARKIVKAYVGVNNVARLCFWRKRTMSYRGFETNLTVNRMQAVTGNAGNYAFVMGGRITNITGAATNVVDAYNQNLTRSTPTTMNGARHNHTGATIYTGLTPVYALAICGTDGTESQFMVDAYNSAAVRTVSGSNWRKTIPMAASIGNYVIGAGGLNYDGSPSLFAESWSDTLTVQILSPLIAARYGGSAISFVGNRATFVGGINGTTDMQDVDFYDRNLTRTNGWTLTPRAAAAVANAGKQGLIMGGRNAADTTRYSDVLVLTGALAWTTTTSLTNARKNGTGVTSPDKRFALCAFGTTGTTYTNATNVYDYYNEALTRTSGTMGTTRYLAAGAPTNNHIIVAGGVSTVNTASAVCEAFNVPYI